MQTPFDTSSRSAESGFDLDRLRLRFRDPEVEDHYRLESLNEARVLIRTYLIAAAVLYLSFGVLDAVVGGDLVQTLWFIRYGVACPILVGVALATYLPSFERFAQVAISAATAIPGVGVVVMTAIMPPPFNSLYYAGLIMVLIYGSTLVRLRFINALLISLSLVAMYQVVSLVLNPIPVKDYVSSNIFLVNMSQELRTPLNAIIGFSDILKKELFGAINNDKYSEYVRDINDSGHHLLSIINDILDLAKAEAGKLSLQEDEVDLSRCLEDAMRMCRGRAATAGVDLVFPGMGHSLYAYVDERLIRQIVLNLLTNAVKFTHQGGRVTLTLSSDDDAILIRVADTGIGIAPEDIERIIRPFEQVETVLSRTHGGTGLGLPLTAKLTELHGGELTIESQVQQGTTVTVRLPADRLRAAPVVRLQTAV